MSYIVHILAALFALALPELGWGTEHERPWLLPVLCVVPYALAWSIRNRLLHARYKSAAAVDRVLDWSPVLLHAFGVTVFGWTRSIEAWWGWETSLTRWPGPGLLLGLLPYVFLQLLAIDARVRTLDPRTDRRRELRAFHARMFLSALLPFLLFLSFSVLVSAREAWQVHIEEVALYNTLFVGSMIGVFVLAVPFLLERTWETAPLERGWSRTLLEDVARRGKFRCRELLVWRTGNNMANAAIVGFTPRSRVVLFTDALLAQLGPRELAAVFAHEIGHARGRHPLIFAGFALLLFFGADLLLVHLALESELVNLGIFLGLFVLWLLAFGFLSRRFELEADLASVELLGDGQPLLDALEQIGGGHASRKSTWRHFGPRRRMEFLESAARDPDTGPRLRRGLRRWKGAGALVFAIVVVLQATALAESFATDLVMVDLRLGRYEHAAARLAGGAEVEENVARLVERAAALGSDAWSPEELEALARRAFEGGERREVLELLELAILRGHRGLDHVYGAVRTVAGDAPDGVPPRPLTPDEVAPLPAKWVPLLTSPPGG